MKQLIPSLKPPLPHPSKPLDVWSQDVRIENKFLIWNFEHAPGTNLFEDKRLTILRKFIRLANGSNEKILAFAREYGPLGLCRCGVSFGHRDRDGNRCYRTYPARKKPKVHPPYLTRESIDGWRRYIKWAKGILTVARKLHRDEKANDMDWAWVMDLGSNCTNYPHIISLASNLENAPLSANTLIDQKQRLSKVVNYLLDECEVGPSITWCKQNIKVAFGLRTPFGFGNRLLDAIVVQLFGAVLRVEGLANCSVCGIPYRPTRSPREGENHYCEDCKSSTNKIAKRKTRAKGKGVLTK